MALLDDVEQLRMGYVDDDEENVGKENDERSDAERGRSSRENDDEEDEQREPRVGDALHAPQLPPARRREDARDDARA